MAGQVRSIVRRAVHTHINHLAATRERHSGHRSNQRVAVANAGRPAVENRADGVACAPAAAGRTTPHPAGSNQQLRGIERIHQKRRWCGHRFAIASHICIRDQWDRAERRRRAGRALRTAVDGDSRLVVHIPIRAIPRINRDRTSVARQNLRPVRSCSRALHAGSSVHSQPGHQAIRRCDRLGQAHHLRKRTQAAVQVLEMRGIRRRARRSRLSNRIR